MQLCSICSYLLAMWACVFAEIITVPECLAFLILGPPCLAESKQVSAEKKQCVGVSTSLLLAPQLSIGICSLIESLGEASFDCHASYLSLLKCALEGLDV